MTNKNTVVAYKCAEKDLHEVSRFDWGVEGGKITSSEGFDESLFCKRSDGEYNNISHLDYDDWNEFDRAYEKAKNECVTSTIVRNLMACALQHPLFGFEDLSKPSDLLVNKNISQQTIDTYYEFLLTEISMMILQEVDIPWKINGDLLRHVFTRVLDEWSESDIIYKFATWIATCAGNKVDFIQNIPTAA